MDRLLEDLYAFRRSAMILRAPVIGYEVVAKELNLSPIELHNLKIMHGEGGGGKTISGGLIAHVMDDYKLWISSDPTAHQPLDKDIYLGSMHQRAMILSRHWHKFFAGMELKDKIVADYGCGPATLSTLMISMGAREVYAFDRFEHIEYLKYKWKSPYKNLFLEGKDLITSVIEDRAFEYIFCGEVFHGKSEADCKKIAHRARLELKPGGRFTVTELDSKTAMGRHFDVQMKLRTKEGKLYNAREIENILESVGFKLEGTYDATPYHFAVTGKKEA